jgi:AAA15 family ATPase/GTPase
MLIRLIINNFLSFGEEKEFNMLPMPRLRTLKEHKYNINGFDILKMASIYGANGAGKSNLVKSMLMFEQLILSENPLINFSNNKKFKFSRDNQPQTFIIEFIQDEKAFLYGFEILDNIVISEELYLSGLGKKENKLLFDRTTDRESKKVTLKTPLLNDKAGKILISIIEKNLAKSNKTIFKLLTTLNSSKLQEITTALTWFKDTLVIVTPDAKPSALVQKIDTNKKFKFFTEDLMKSFHIGINKIEVEKKTLEDFFGKNDVKRINNILEELDNSKNNMIGLQTNGGQEIIITKEDANIYVKKLQISHQGKDDIEAMFDLEEESDGTVRLLDFAPAFQDIAINKKVYIVDEIERSIHPLLIKELVSKFSKDNKSNGQLIFTTHESNLLDQSIFRQDEIWFAEKNKNGSTDLYSLSDFKKEHNTIDIRKGYLIGRYGSIPFLGNLKDLNWHDYEITE